MSSKKYKFFHLFADAWGNSICAVTIAVMLGACIVVILFGGYVPPISPWHADGAEAESFSARTGVELPHGAHVISVSDGHPRDGTKGYFHWAIFTNVKIDFPGKIKLFPDETRLGRSVRGAESMMRPYKIQEPTNVSLYSWSFGRTEIRITEIKGKIGFYILAETYQF